MSRRFPFVFAFASVCACTSTPSDLPPCVDPNAVCAPLDDGGDGGDAADGGDAGALEAATD